MFIEQEIVEYNESALPSVCVYMDSAMFVEHSSGTMSMSFLLVHLSVCVQLSKLIGNVSHWTVTITDTDPIRSP